MNSNDGKKGANSRFLMISKKIVPVQNRKIYSTLLKTTKYTQNNKHIIVRVFLSSNCIESRSINDQNVCFP